VLAPIAAGEPRVDWLDSRGESSWSITFSAPPDQEGLPLEAEEWFPPLPRLALPLITESPTPQLLPLESFRGQVLVVDFWASWCAPCLEALPSLQKLVESKKDRGLAALAVNVDEDDVTARRFAVALGLELPLLRLTPGMDALFDIKKLPTTLVIDRQGRVRTRFNGSHAGLEAQLAAAVERLLDDVKPQRYPLATVHQGRAGVVWSRELNGNTQAVAAMPEGAAVGRALLTLVGWDVAGLDADGRVRVNKRAGSGYESLLLSDAGESGGVGIYTFRRFGKRVAPIKFGRETLPLLELEEHLLDVRPDGATQRLWLGTSSGLRRVDLQGVEDSKTDTLGAIWGIGPGASPRAVLAVSDQPAVHWLDEQLSSVKTVSVFGDARQLLAGEDPGRGLGVATQEISGWSVGSFIDKKRVHLAVAAGDLLRMIDVESGSVDFEARWPGIRGLAAYDPASTGQSMLAVASAKRVTLIRVGE